LKIKATAPGKLILLGEYAVLEGAPALVMAVNRYAEVTLETISSEFNILEAPAIGIFTLPFLIKDDKVSFLHSISKEQQEKLNFFIRTLEHTLQSYEQSITKLSKIKITINTSQFFNETDNQKFGLGSSAALTVALLAALIKFGNQVFEIGKETDLLLKTALQTHRQAQGNLGSGIDITASVLGGILQYQIIDKEFSQVPFYDKLTIPDDLHILIIWTGSSASTKNFIQKIEEYRRKQSDDFDNIIKEMNKISTQGIEAIKLKDTSKYLEAVEKYYNEMKNLGLQSSTPIISKNHQENYEIVAHAGGVYKPSGAGGGDLGIAFCNSLRTREIISNNLENTDYKIINLEISKNGIQIITA
jgi:phosphomevalonate kinase